VDSKPAGTYVLDDPFRSATQAVRALQTGEVLIEQIEHFLQQYDVWVYPVFPTAAFAHCAPNGPIAVDDRQISQLAANLLHSIIFNVSGHPVVTIPIGRTVDGLPVGVQLVGRRSGELALLAAAEQIAACIADPGELDLFTALKARPAHIRQAR
jgi:Asp-tRNA(Asn)/Glu-tRNA(Gln) amidotransferase A subunit family amidase